MLRYEDFGSFLPSYFVTRCDKVEYKFLVDTFKFSVVLGNKTHRDIHGCQSLWAISLKKDQTILKQLRRIKVTANRKFQDHMLTFYFLSCSSFDGKSVGEIS